MKQLLAERLLMKVMGWNGARLAEELPILDRMARFKYDEYQRFAPGRKFIESLGLWLDQFESSDERETAYAFVKRRLVFASSQEMRHLVEASFPDAIRPILIRNVAAQLGIPRYRLSQVINNDGYRRMLRASLFLGLSDGAQMDVFRRTANLDNEQVWQAYELSNTKSDDMLKNLRKNLASNNAFFECVFLLDDFSASGRSYIRKEDGIWKGKIVKAIRQFTRPKGEASNLLSHSGCNMYIVLYVATQIALDHIRENLNEFLAEHTRRPVGLRQKIRRIFGFDSGRQSSFLLSMPHVFAVYELPAMTALDDGNPDDEAFLALVDDDRYYRGRGLDEHEEKGGTSDMKRGFAGCALPLVLSHNCPNNSVYLLCAEDQEPGDRRGLFPRRTRHKDLS